MRDLRALPRQRRAGFRVEPPVTHGIEADADRLAFAEALVRCGAGLDQVRAEANFDEVERAEQLGVLRNRIDAAWIDAHELRPDAERRARRQRAAVRRPQAQRRL